ncbi:MAG: hypothetical protein GY771_01810, partial [bacterium]|nr:hypothetical protein [bacterium]
MAKDYQKGDDYKLYFNTATYATPTWAEIVAADDIAVEINKSDIEVPERGIDTGHLQGKGDGTLSFTLMEDTGDTNVESMIAAVLTDATMIHLAVSRGDITTTGT